MKHNNFFFFFFPVFLVSLLTTQLPRCLADTTEFTNCSKTLECGTSFPEIGYPFWGLNRADYCGAGADYHLTCTSDATLQITISGTTYRVLQYDTASSTLSIAISDYYNNLCPASLTNVTSVAPFNFSSDTVPSNLTVYYNCSSLTAIPTTVNQFTCSLNGVSGVTNYFVTRSVSDLVGAAAVSVACGSSVVFPVNGTALAALEADLTEANVAKAVDGGFGVKWTDEGGECERCVASGGQCGRNTSSADGFVCYCSDKAYSSACASSSSATAAGNKNQTPLSVGLALAGAALAGLLLGFWIFSCKQKRKRKREAAAAAAAESSQTKEMTPFPSGGLTAATSTNSYTRTTPSYTSSKSDLEKGSTYFGAQLFSYAELEAATNHFDPTKQLGEGGFGTVYYGELPDGRIVAVKRLFENNLKRVEQFMNELEILTRLRHENLVVLFGCTSRRSRELLLVYEYIPNGTLGDHLHGKKSGSGLLPWKVRLDIAIETADALSFLHKSDVIHRDVKTNNILLDNEFRVKVADFGLSRLFPNDVTHVSTAPQGTPGYVDPEYYQIYQLTEKSDVYSFGVVLCELLSSKPAVDMNRHRHDINLANMAINKIQNHALREFVDPSLGFETDYKVKRMTTLVAELAFRCLQQERETRPTMVEVLETLRRIKNEDYSNSQTAEIVDIGSDEDAEFLKNPVPPPMSPDSVATDKQVGDSSTRNSF